MSVKVNRRCPARLSKSQVASKSDSDRILVGNLLDQNRDMMHKLENLTTDYELLKSKTDRSIGSLKDEVSWLKFCIGLMCLASFVYILGDVLGAW